MDLQKSVSRLAIFQCSDRQGIIDDYIPYLLNDLKENLTKLVIVVNGLLTPEGRAKLTALTPHVVCRENVGFDAAAWKYAMTEYLGWEEVEKYDELILLNDTFFGPFYPFREVFEKMQARSVDFWGLTQHGKMDSDPFGNNPYGHWPAHLQSYFLCIRKKMLGSAEFKKYWTELPVFRTWDELVGKNETFFTKHFEDCGFTWDSFISNGDTDKLYGYNPYSFNTYEILCQGFPVIKRKEFAAPLGLTLEFNNAEDYRRAFEWIRENTSYDTKLIFQNILRNYNIGNIHDALHLDYIIDDKREKQACRIPQEAAIVLHISYAEKIGRYVPFVKNIPDGMDVYVTTTSEEKGRTIERNFSPILGDRMHVLVMRQNRGRDLAGLLVAARPHLQKYKYICFCHDKISKQSIYTIGNSFERILWENTLKSREYICNVLSELDSDENLGILAVPSPVTSNFIYPLGTHWWGTSFKNTAGVLDRLNISVPCVESETCLTIGTAFWCKTAALKPLWDYEWKFEDFPEEPMPVDGCLNHALERCFAYVAQSQGYYTGIAMTPEWASVFVNDYKYGFLNDYLWKRHGLADTVHTQNPYSDTDFVARQIGVKNAFRIFRRAVHIKVWKITKSKKL